MKIILATGVPELDNAIEANIKNVTFLGSALYKEAVVDVVQRKKPDVVILSELLEGVTPMRELILTLRTRFPEVRIIYILKDDDPKEKAFLYHWMIFDVFAGTFTVPQLAKTLHNPKEFKDVHHELEILKQYNKDPELMDDNVDISDMTNINASDYSKINGPTSGNHTLYQQVVAFWSVLDQSGKTFVATNTALALAGQKDLKILLIDFNLDNPNINLYYSFVDPNRNLGAIIDDVEQGQVLNSKNLEQYLITHPVYSNLKILPGAILKMKKRDPEFLFAVFEKIIEVAEQNNFSTILIDTQAGLDELTTNILKKVSKIMLHIKETPGSLNALYRCFDTEAGPFVEKLIDRRKMIPIITESYTDTQTNFKRAVHGFLETPVGASVPFSSEVRPSLYKGVPVLSKKPPEDLYNAFIRISNLIHKNIFQEPNAPRKPLLAKNESITPAKEEKKSLLGGFLGSKKKK